MKSPKTLTRMILVTLIGTILLLSLIVTIAELGPVFALIAFVLLFLDGVFMFILVITSLVHLLQFFLDTQRGKLFRRFINVLLSGLLFIGTLVLVVFVVLGALVILLPFTA